MHTTESVRFRLFRLSTAGNWSTSLVLLYFFRGSTFHNRPHHEPHQLKYFFFYPPFLYTFPSIERISSFLFSGCVLPRLSIPECDGDSGPETGQHYQSGNVSSSIPVSTGELPFAHANLTEPVILMSHRCQLTCPNHYSNNEYPVLGRYKSPVLNIPYTNSFSLGTSHGPP